MIALAVVAAAAAAIGVAAAWLAEVCCGMRGRHARSGPPAVPAVPPPPAPPWEGSARAMTVFDVPPSRVRPHVPPGAVPADDDEWWLA